PTIQSAVDDAQPGDLILIKAGVYPENVAVNTPKLIITGDCANPAAVAVDAAPGNVQGIGFAVDAANTSIQCLAVRFGTYGINATADKLTVTSVEIFGQQIDNLDVQGDAFTINDSVFLNAQ